MTFAATAFIILGGYLFVMNWACLIASLTTTKYHSMTPPLGGFLLTIGLALHPATQRYCLLGILLDCGFWAILLSLPRLLAQQCIPTVPWNRVALYSGQWLETTCTVSLYRPDHYTIRFTRRLEPGSTGWTERRSFGRWRDDQSLIALVSHLDATQAPCYAILSRSEKLESSITVSECVTPKSLPEPELPMIGTQLRSK